MSELLNIKQASEFLNVTQDCLRKWDKSGKLKPLKTVGGHRRYVLDELKKFIGLPFEEKDKDKPLAFTGWYEKEKQSILNSNFNRTIESNIIFICGNSYLLAEGPILFQDDIKGC